jgi:hypothetical protein
MHCPDNLVLHLHPIAALYSSLLFAWRLPVSINHEGVRASATSFLQQERDPS